jgi:hypothetical protein
MFPVPLRIATRSKIAPMSPKNGSSRCPANAFEAPPSNETTDFAAMLRYSGVERRPMLFGAVVPLATTVVFPFAIRVTENGWAVSPRKNWPVLRWNVNR